VDPLPYMCSGQHNEQLSTGKISGKVVKMIIMVVMIMMMMMMMMIMVIMMMSV